MAIQVVGVEIGEAGCSHARQMSGSERSYDAAIEAAGEADSKLAVLELAREPGEGPVECRAGLSLKIGNAQLGVSRNVAQLLTGELGRAIARDLQHLARRARRDRRQRNSPLPDPRDAVADNEMTFAVAAEEKLAAADGVASEMDGFAAPKCQRILSRRQAAGAQAPVQDFVVRQRRIAKYWIVAKVDQLHGRHNTAESLGWHAAERQSKRSRRNSTTYARHIPAPGPPSYREIPCAPW